MTKAPIAESPGAVQPGRFAALEIANALTVREYAAGAPVIIAFSSVNSNGFSFYKNLEPLPFSRIYVRDPADRWFQRGIGSGLDTPDALAAHLRVVLKALKPARIVTTGASMGGYAALLFGHLLRAQAVFAMSPQTIIDRRLPHTPPEDFAGHPYFDLAPLLRARDRHRPPTHILFGSDDMVDIWNAARIARLPGDVHFPVAGRDHLASNLVTANGDLARCLQGLATGEPFTPTTPLDTRYETQRIRAIVDRLVRSLYLGEPGLEPEEWAERLRRLEPEWSVPYDALAMLARRAGDLAAAEVASGRAAALAPKSITLQTTHAELLMRLGRDAEAAQAYERCLAIRPKHYAALCALGVLRSRAGDKAGALAKLDAAIAIRPRLARAHTLRAAIVKGEAMATAGQETPEDM
jgi:dienelactone hydrolase